ncbi:annexin D4-like isoform X2 [Vitis riparia]|uniref:annexin D4-like isoform X2 n=1 Tax=Vitis riparia TaxID=96939 RepID=UPI00155B0525|nr:annexin D4-like isoform X2 [Vitis riparia]
MDPPNDFEALTKAFSGKWHSEHLESFRKRTKFFLEDERLFERWDDHHIACLTKEFLRFKDIVVQWIMHPWERDARLVHEAITKGPQAYGLLIEIACTRSSEELLGARKAYQSLFVQSIEDVVSRLEGIERKLLVALVSSYRYEGSRVNEGTARSEATTLAIAVKNVDKKNPIEDDGIVRILTTRSKLHLKAVVKYYKEIYGKNIDEDLDTLMSLKETLQCLCNPQAYFSKVLNDAFKDDADENTKDALTRVIVTRSNVDMKEIIEEFDKQYKIPLTQKIEDVALGNYKDFLVSLIRRVA